jgi:hypothetical protein
MKLPLSGRLVAAAVVAAMGSAVVLARQQAGPDAGTLAALTAEVRLLRLSVEKSAQTQAQIQALSVYLAAEQSRLVQVSSRADSLQKDLDAAVLGTAVATDRVDGLQNELRKTQPPEMKAEIEEALAGAKRDLKRATATESQIQIRQSEAAATMQSELGRWSELIARLQRAANQ